MRLLLTAAYLAAFFMLTPAEAGDLSPWFKSLKQPGTGASCCDISDCRALQPEEVRIENGEYKVLLFGNWLPVPEDKVLHGYGNPTKVPVACGSPSRVYCFVEGELA